MEKCKYCQQELEEGSTVCPHCGKDNAVPRNTAEEVPAAEQAEGIPAAEEPAVKEETPAAEESAVKEETSAEKAEEPAEPSEEKKENSEEEKPEEEKPEEASREEKPEEKKKATPGQMALGIGAIVVLAAVLIALIISALGQKKEEVEIPAETEATEALTEPTEPTIPADGNPDDVTCKGTYTTDGDTVKAAARDVVATMGEYQLDNAKLQVYYWKGVQSFLQGNPYAAYLINPQISLDMQVCPLVEGLTWQQFFLQSALEAWHNDQAMTAEAETNRMPENAELTKYLKELPAQFEAAAKDAGFADSEALLAANVGPASTMQDYMDVMEILNTGYSYYLYFMSVAQPDEAALETYFQENEETLKEGGITKDTKSVNVRHCLISPEDPEAEDSWKAAEQKAQDLLKSFESGEKSEEAFAAMASEHSMDPGSQANGGLYEGVVLGQMVPEFEQWCFDNGRKTGDFGVVKTDFGYHIMFYSGDQLIWRDQVTKLIMDQKTEELMERNAATYPLHVDYSKIFLAEPVTQG